MLAFPDLKPTATRWSGRGGGEHTPCVERRAGATALLLRSTWLGEAARKAQAPLPWLRGAALEARTPVAKFMPRLRRAALGARVPFRIRTMAEGNGTRSACSRRRNRILAEGNRTRSVGSRRRYSAVRMCNRRRRSPWALDRGNYRCVAGQTGNRYTRILRNKRRFFRQCWRRTGWVSRTAGDLSFTSAEGTWLVRVRVAARVVGGSKAHSGSRSGGRKGWRGWDTSLVARHV